MKPSISNGQPIVNELATILPLPFGRGEGRGEGCLLRLRSIYLATLLLSGPFTFAHEPPDSPADPLAHAEGGLVKAEPQPGELDDAVQKLGQAQQLSVGGGTSSGFGGGTAGFGGGGTSMDRLAAVVHRGSGSGSGSTLVLSSSELEPKQQADLQEDLAVMSHILDKAVTEKLGHEPAADRVLGINVYFTPNRPTLNNLYLDGYGAVFMLNVGFPLLPPPAKSETEKEKPAVDSAWQEAKDELYGRSEDKSLTASFPEYDEAKVAKLKEAVIEALKNASNIRNVKADESITVCIFGGASGHHRFVTQKAKSPSSSAGSNRTDPTVRLWDTQSGKLAGAAPMGSTMTIRVKKSDADAFAKGKLTVEEFRKKAKMTTYASAMNGSENANGFFGQSYPFGVYSYGAPR